MNILKLFLLSLVALSCSSPAHAMWNSIRNRTAQAATKAAAYMRTQGPKLHQAFARQAPALNNGLLKYGTALVGAGLITATLGDTAISAQGAQPDAFTKEQLDDSVYNRRHHQDRHYFMDIAAQHIAAQDEETIAMILYVLKVYHQAGAYDLMPTVKKEFELINPRILKEILRINPDAAQDYLELLFTTPSTHLHALLENFKVNNIGYFDRYRHLRPPVNSNYEWFTHNDDEQISLSELVVQSAIANPQAVSVDVFNTIYSSFKGTDATWRISSAWQNTAQALQQAAKKHYKIDPKTMIDLYRTGVITRTEEPLCIYQDRPNWRPDLQIVTDIILQNVDTLSAADLNFIFYQLERNKAWDLRSHAQQDALCTAVQKRFGKVTKDTLCADQLLNAYKKNSYVSYAYSDRGAYDTTLEIPLLLHEKVSQKDVLQATMRDYQTASIETCNWAHYNDYLFDSQEEKQKLQKLAQERFGKAKTDMLCADQLLDIFKNHSRQYNTTLNVPDFFLVDVSLDSVVQSTVRDYQTVSVATLEWVYNDSTASQEQKQEIKKLAQKRFYKEPEEVAALGADQLLDLYETQTTLLKIPNFIQNGIARDDIVRATKRDYQTASKKTFDRVYNNAGTSQQDKKELEELAEKRWPRESEEHIFELITTCPDQKPRFLCETCPGTFSPQTQTECHLCTHLRHIIVSLFQYKAWAKQPVQQMFKDALVKEQEEATKGNYTFYHARKPEWDFISDLYKLVHNATCPADQHVGESYTFLRFDDSKSSYAGAGNVDALFLNGPLFGNAQKYDDSSAQLALQNLNWDGNKYKTFTPEYILASFKQEKLYTQYKDEINNLKDLHEKAHCHNVGNLLMIVLDEQNIDRVYPVSMYADKKKLISLKDGQETTETKKVVQAYKLGNLVESDRIEFVLPLTKDYALDPHKGLVVHSFRATDPIAWKEYETARDQLSAKIRTDINTSKNVKIV